MGINVEFLKEFNGSTTQETTQETTTKTTTKTTMKKYPPQQISATGGGIPNLIGIIIDFNLIHFLVRRKGGNHFYRLVIVVHNIVYFARFDMNHLSR